jgi:hypothetical protein
MKESYDLLVKIRSIGTSTGVSSSKSFIGIVRDRQKGKIYGSRIGVDMQSNPW